MACQDDAACAPMPTSTTARRVALARRRFFEEGLRPDGLVPEAVLQSWARCAGAHRKPAERIAFEPLAQAQVSATLARHRSLLEAARPELARLDAVLAGTSCKAFLTSADGVILHATPTDARDGALMAAVARIGVDIGERSVGTGAPGLAALAGEASVVCGAEHYFGAMAAMHCAAAPIRGVRGNVVGVLDISREGAGFRFDALALTAAYAAAIEARWLDARSRKLLVLRFHSRPGLLTSPLAGRAGIGADGRIDWVDGPGAQQLGCDRAQVRGAPAEALIGLGPVSLLALARGGAMRRPLPNGLALWLQARSPAGWQAALAPEPHAAASDAPGTPVAVDRALPPTLGDSSRALIERTLAGVGGNVSQAARVLGVSRGLLYRRLAAWQGADRPRD